MRGGPAPLELRGKVAAALRRRQPVVALESSVIAQGLPHPLGVLAARRCEAAVVAAGATAATVGVIGGRIVVGLTASELESLASGPNVAKAAERDLAPLSAANKSAGTTVSATCAVAARCGIRIVSTGGIGGVHRTFRGPPDVSSDLFAVARLPVAVVCAGAKAVVDVPATFELLEALSVLVLGYRTRSFPLFYTAAAGLSLEHAVQSPAEAARALLVRFEVLGQGGALVVRPPPGGGLPRRTVERAVGAAVRKMRRAGVSGKAVTPYLLRAVAEATSGASDRVNLDTLEANARLAGEIAAALARKAR